MSRNSSFFLPDGVEESSFHRTSSDANGALNDQLDHLFRYNPIGVGMTLFIGVIISIEIYDVTREIAVLVWLACHTIISCARLYLTRAYLLAKRTSKSPDYWLRTYVLGTLASGLCWGISGVIFFPQLNSSHQLFLLFVLIGVVSGGLPLLSAVWWLYGLFALTVILPFCIMLVIMGGKLNFELSLIIPILLSIHIGIAYRLNQLFIQGYHLRLDFGRINEDYTHLNNRLERQLSELSEAQRQIETSGRKLTLFAERAPIAVLEISAQGQIEFMNSEAKKLLDLDLDEVRTAGNNIEILAHPALHEEMVRRWNFLVLHHQAIAGLRLETPRSDGTNVICEWTITPLIGPDGECISVIAQGRNVTEELASERIKREFTATLSHELRTPLTSIIGSLQLINSGFAGELQPELAELTAVAERNGVRLLDLINDLLDIEKIQSGTFALDQEEFFLDELIIESIALNQSFAERFDVQLCPEESMPNLLVKADRKHLLQIMTNLLSNAAKFSPPGEIVQVTLSQQGQMATVMVSDRGPGVPMNFRHRIFSRFAQADATATRLRSGTGLGLAICKGMIELMSGQIGFRDRPNGGSIFWFQLPISGVLEHA